MDRRQFFSLFIFSILGSKLRAQYPEIKNLKSDDSDMTYILLNLYESPPRWLFDLPLRPSDSDKMISSPMITTCLENGVPIFKTTKIGNINMPSLWENVIPSSSGEMVAMSSLLDSAVIIRGCNMNRDGHDENSKKIESPSEGRVSLGGRIADNYPSKFSAISVAGDSADPLKGVISAFRTKKGLKAFSCEESLSINYIKQILDLYTPFKSQGGEGYFNLVTEDLLHKINNDVRVSEPLAYSKVRELNKLPFEEIYSFFEKSKKKYVSLLDQCRDKLKIKNLTDSPMPGVKFPISFDLNKDSSKAVLDYLGAYHFENYIVTDENINDLFDKCDHTSLAERFALAEVSLKYELSNVLLLNIDPFRNINLKNAAPLEKITHTIKGSKITFDCSSKYLFSTTDKKYSLNNDSHYVGTIPALIGFSKLFHGFSSCLYELQEFLKKETRNGESLYNKTVIHITSEFERSPQLNQAGSDHGWQGHTSTLMSGMFKGFHLLGNIKISSNNVLNNHKSTWGEGAILNGIDRQIRYGDIVNSISHLFAIKPTQGGVSLLVKKKGHFYPRFLENQNRDL
jgi:hypothetical protein